MSYDRDIYGILKIRGGRHFNETDEYLFIWDSVGLGRRIEGKKKSKTNENKRKIKILLLRMLSLSYFSQKTHEWFVSYEVKSQIGQKHVALYQKYTLPSQLIDHRSLLSLISSSLNIAKSNFFTNKQAKQLPFEGYSNSYHSTSSTNTLARVRGWYFVRNFGKTTFAHSQQHSKM